MEWCSTVSVHTFFFIYHWFFIVLFILHFVCWRFNLVAFSNKFWHFEISWKISKVLNNLDVRNLNIVQVHTILPLDMAHIAAVAPKLSVALMSAPFSIRSLVSSSWPEQRDYKIISMKNKMTFSCEWVDRPCSAALIKGVQLFLSLAFTFDPLSIKDFTIFIWSDDLHFKLTFKEAFVEYVSEISTYSFRQLGVMVNFHCYTN